MRMREEEPADIGAIRAVVAAAFGQTLEADLVDRLRADGACVLSLVALEGEALVGHVMFSRMVAPFTALGLAPLSVLPAWQRRGIGGALVREGLRRLAQETWEETWQETWEAPWQAVFVLGDPAYYQRFGFDASRASGFTSPYAGPYLMALSLQGELPARSGRIDYAPAFAGLE